MIHALITGELHRDPVQRTGNSGKPFVTASFRVTADGETLWANVITFDDGSMEALLRLRAGDPVSVQGRLTVSVFTGKDGGARPSLSLVATGVLGVKPAAKPRKRPDQRSGAPAGRPQSTAPFVDDVDLGF